MIDAGMLPSITDNPNLLHWWFNVPDGLQKSEMSSMPRSVSERLACGHVIRILSFRCLRLDSDHRFKSKRIEKATFNADTLITSRNTNPASSQNVLDRNFMIDFLKIIKEQVLGRFTNTCVHCSHNFILHA